MLVRDLVRQHRSNLTAAERRIVPFLQDDSLVIELQSITKLADAASVSTPTVIRLARKLGFDGFPDLQNAIRSELAERIKQPLAKLEAQLPSAHQDHIVTSFAQRAVDNLNQTIGMLDFQMFDDVAKLLAQSDRHLFLLGGRITRSSADHFFNHLQIIRPNVSLLSSSPSVWPQTVLDMDHASVLIIFDIRRYQKELERLSELAAGQGAEIILFTDQWGSPIERFSGHCFRTTVEAPSSWDSTIAINFLVEAMIAEVQKQLSDLSADRILEMERMIGETKLFGSS
ncbi:MAG: MurR/RpiR family transcriptional regulator [Geminicoccaceae bacterium]